MKKKILYAIATGLGAGYSPYIPGTAGSFLALILIYFLPIQDMVWLFLTIIFFLIGLWASGFVEKETEKDPKIVVIDEIVGQWIALLFLPKVIWIYVSAFILFRLLDIFKPFPILEMEEFKGGYGIMLDDLVAGIYTNLALNLILIFLM